MQSKGYKPNVISTIVDVDKVTDESEGYKPNVISTIVDSTSSWAMTEYGYKPNVISTIVDLSVRLPLGDGL